MANIDSDLDLPPVKRSLAIYWELKALIFLKELQKANKGIRRLKRQIDRLKAKNT